MSRYHRPFVIQCAELASERAIGNVRTQLAKRVSSLATVASTAVLIGLLGTMFGILGSFRSFGGSRSYVIAYFTNSLGEALIPGLLGILVSTMAFSLYRTLQTQLEDFDFEMKIARDGVVSGLTAYLQALKSSNKALWLALSKGPSGAAGVPVLRVASPLLGIVERARHGVWQLLWPKLESETDAGAVLAAAGGIGIVYGAIGCLVAWEREHWITGILTLAFFEAARRALGRGSRWAVFAVIAFLALLLFVNVRQYGWSDGSVCIAVGLVPFSGSVAASFRVRSESGRVRNLSLASLWILASLALSLPVDHGFNPF